GDIVEREKLVEQAAVRGEAVGRLLEPLRAHPHVGDVRGRGVLWGVELEADTTTRVPFPRSERKAEAVAAQAFRDGLVTYPSGGCADGTNGDVILLAPPFVVSEAQLAEMVTILDGALAACGPWWGHDGRGAATCNWRFPPLRGEGQGGGAMND